MKTRWMLSGLCAGSLLLLGGCGAGQYKIPNVAPVVKPKPQDDLLEQIEGADTSSGESTEPAPEGSSNPPSSTSTGSDSSSADSTSKPAK